MSYTLPMTVLRALFVAGILALCAGCRGGTQEVGNGGTPIAQQQEFDLSRSDVTRASILAQQGDLLNVSVEITQKADQYAQCGKPKFADSHGNTVTLVPQTVTATGAAYGYSHVAAVTGMPCFLIMLNVMCAKQMPRQK